MRRLAALLAAAALAGCASVPPPQPGWISGRLALQVEATAQQPARALSAGFELRGDDTQGELRLFSPLGTQLAWARWQPGLAQWVTSDGARDFGGLDALAREGLGEEVPLGALADWLSGRPWPRAPSRALPDGFEQLGWRVSLGAFAEGRIEAWRVTPPALRLRVQLEPQVAPAPQGPRSFLMPPRLGATRGGPGTLLAVAPVGAHAARCTVACARHVRTSLA